MVTKTIFTLLILVLLISNVSANGGAAAAAAAATQQQQIRLQQELQNSGGCTPPMEFAEEHNCDLQFARSYEVASYECIKQNVVYVIKGDCEGGVVNFEEQSLFYNSLIGFLPLLLMLVLLLVGLAIFSLVASYLLNRNNKKTKFIGGNTKCQR